MQQKGATLEGGCLQETPPPTQCKALTSQASYKAIFGISKPNFTVKQSQNKKSDTGQGQEVSTDASHQNQQTKTRNEHKSYGQTKKHAAQKKNKQTRRRNPNTALLHTQLLRKTEDCYGTKHAQTQTHTHAIILHSPSHVPWLGPPV